jgi:hypothetical protein
VCGVTALTIVGVACSNGGSHVSVKRHASRASDAASVTSSTERTSSAAHSKKKAKAHKKKTSDTSGTTARSSGTTAATSGGATVPLGGQTGGVPTTVVTITVPTTHGTTTTTIYAGPRPYDPTKPINLCCEPGVTLAEQHRAEELVRDTLRDIPKYASTATAEAAGYRSIEDQATGAEHYVNWAYAADADILDSKHPESLVYEVIGGKKTLVAAMYSLPLGSTFADVPDVGGPLTQWHVHNDLCLTQTSDPLQRVVSSIVGVNSPCPAGSAKDGSAPMLHVWIIANPCGPFAALGGLSGGQIPDGQDRLCDTGHGSG